MFLAIGMPWLALANPQSICCHRLKKVISSLVLIAETAISVFGIPKKALVSSNFSRCVGLMDYEEKEASLSELGNTLVYLITF